MALSPADIPAIADAVDLYHKLCNDPQLHPLELEVAAISIGSPLRDHALFENRYAVSACLILRRVAQGQEIAPAGYPKEIENADLSDKQKDALYGLFEGLSWHQPTWIDDAQKKKSLRRLRGFIDTLRADRPNGPYTDLSQFAAVNMIGKELRIVELVCEHDGKYPIAGLAIDSKIQWVRPWDNACKNRLRAINDKLRGKRPWRLKRSKNAVIVQKIPPSGTRPKKA